MSVQDIVQLYEGKTSGSDPKGSLSRRNRYKPRKSDAEIIPPGSEPEDFPRETVVQEPVLVPPEPAQNALPNRPARFVRHPFFQPHYQRIQTPDVPLRTLSKSPERRSAKAEGLPNYRSPTPRLARKAETPVRSDESQPIDSSNSDASTLRVDAPEAKSDKQPDELLAASLTAASTVVDDGATLAGSYSTHLLPTPKDSSAAVHRPVPAPTLFGRGAAPLYLPKLDKYLSSLPAPGFTTWKGNGNQKDAPMFPPMDKLAASKLTIDDLEHNSTITPAWRDRNFWFSLASGAVVGVLVR